MIVPGKAINAFKNQGITNEGSWFTGHMNTQKLNFDPLITGYAFIIWTKLPFWVEKQYPNFADMTQKNFKSFEGLSDIELQTGQYTHTFNGNAYEFATSITKGNTDFTLRHQEFSGNPIKNMYQYWVSGIRDPETDIAVYPRAFNCEYGAKNHTGELLYIMTRPDANNVDMPNIEFSAYYTAVFPTKIPLGHLAYTQNTHDSPEIDINFKGDLHIGPEVDAYAVEELKKAYAFVTSGYFDPKSDSVGNGKTIGDRFDTDPNNYDFKPNNGTMNQPIDAGNSDNAAAESARAMI